MVVVCGSETGARFRAMLFPSDLSPRCALLLGAMPAPCAAIYALPLLFVAPLSSRGGAGSRTIPVPPLPFAAMPTRLKAVPMLCLCGTWQRLCDASALPLRGVSIQFRGCSPLACASAMRVHSGALSAVLCLCPSRLGRATASPRNSLRTTPLLGGATLGFAVAPPFLADNADAWPNVAMPRLFHVLPGAAPLAAVTPLADAVELQVVQPFLGCRPMRGI